MQPNNMVADLKPQGQEAAPKVKVTLSYPYMLFSWNDNLT